MFYFQSLTLSLSVSELPVKPKPLSPATLFFNFCLWPHFSALPPPFLKIIFYINSLHLTTSDELFSTYDFWPGCLFKFILIVVISTFARSREVKNLGFSVRREALQGLKQEGCGATYILLR